MQEFKIKRLFVDSHYGEVGLGLNVVSPHYTGCIITGSFIPKPARETCSAGWVQLKKKINLLCGVNTKKLLNHHSPLNTVN